MRDAAVRSYLALPEERIINWYLLHLSNHSAAIRGASDSLHGFEVVQNRSVNTGRVLIDRDTFRVARVVFRGEGA